jgi:hypothetical protein
MPIYTVNGGKLMRTVEECLDQVVHDALGLEMSRIWGEMNPEDAHGADQVDLYRDRLFASASDLVDALQGG